MIDLTDCTDDELRPECGNELEHYSSLAGNQWLSDKVRSYTFQARADHR